MVMNFDYGYGYEGFSNLEPFAQEGMEGFSSFNPFIEGGLAGIGSFLAVFLSFFYFLTFGIMIVSYVLQSIGMHTIAKRRGINHPWLCWLPIGDVWILGSISDQYQYVAKGKVRNRRKVLLGIAIGVFAVGIPLMVVSLIGWIVCVAGITGGEAGAFGVMFGVFLLVYVAALAVGIVNTVLQYIALYDLFVSCNPDNAVLFLILGIFFPLALPFFVFFSRKKDLGMPPRKEVLPEGTIDV